MSLSAVMKMRQIGNEYPLAGAFVVGLPLNPPRSHRKTSLSINFLGYALDSSYVNWLIFRGVVGRRGFPWQGRD